MQILPAPPSFDGCWMENIYLPIYNEIMHILEDMSTNVPSEGDIRFMASTPPSQPGMFPK